MNPALLHKLKTDGDFLGITPRYKCARCIVVGFSGGADSSLLLEYLAERHRTEPDFPTVCALHVNHMIRGAEADADEEFCRDRCAALGVPFLAVKRDVPAMARERGFGVEECARDVRYTAARDIRKMLLRGNWPFEGRECTISKTEGDVLFATAHNGDDNGETVIFNLARGAGCGGLAGIPPVREDGVIRPILCLSGEDVRRACAHEGIPFVCDSTNATTDYTRNFIRHKVIPHLRALNPSLTDAVARCSAALREDDALLRDMARSAVEKYLPDRPGDVVQIPRDTLASLKDPVLIRALRLAVSYVTPVAMEDVHIRAAVRLVRNEGTGEVSLPDSVTLEVSKFHVTAERQRQVAPFFIEITLPADGEITSYRCPEGGFVLTFARNEEDIPPSCENIYKLSIHTAARFDTIYGKVFARPLSPGDIYVLGGHRRRIKKMLAERGVRRGLRSRLPVICDEKGIIAVPGLPVRGESYAPPGDSALWIGCTFE